MKKEIEYQLFLDQVNKLTERRQAVTATYLSVNAAIVGAVAFIFKDVDMLEGGRQASALVLLISGLVACDLWRRLINQYSTLLEWWYEQLRALEDVMTESSKLLTREHDDLYGGKSGKAPIGLTRYEVRLTRLFTLVYVAFGLVILLALVFS